MLSVKENKLMHIPMKIGYLLVLYGLCFISIINTFHCINILVQKDYLKETYM
jgi:hypothetical protein